VLAADQKERAVSDRTAQELQVGAYGPRVSDVHARLAALGHQVPASEVQRAFFGPGTRQAVMRLQADNGLEPSGQVNGETARVIGLPTSTGDGEVVTAVGSNAPAPAAAVPGGGVDMPVAARPRTPVNVPPDHEPPGGDVYHVAGTVTSPDRAGTGGLVVVVVDRSAGRDDDPVGRTVTDARGRYTLRFAVPSVRERRKQQPDLQVRVYSDTTLLGESAVRYDATMEETLDVLLPPGGAGLPSEHESLTTAVAVHYDGPLHALREDDARQDVTYLANKTGWDARAVALAALADRFGRETAANGAEAAIDPAFFYALFRTGLPANAVTVYRAGVESVVGIWTRAIETGIIPEALKQQLPRAAKAFEQASAARVLDAPPLVGISSLCEMLRRTLGDDTAGQQRFAEFYARHRGDAGAFWQAVTASFGEQTAARLKLDGQLGFLTLDNAPLIARLHGAEASQPLASPADLAHRGYYRAEKWLALIDGAVPEQIPGETPEERAAKYADVLAATVRLSFPTAVVADLVRSEELPVNGGTAVRDGVQAFLAEHAGAFEIGMNPVEQYLVRNQLTGAVAGPVQDELKRIQRVYQITPTDGAMAALLKLDLDSAYRVVRYGETQFVESLKDALGGEEAARLTYWKSLQVHNAVLNIALTYLGSRVAPGIGVSSPAQVLDPGPGDGVGSDVVAYPTLKSLFNSLDFCACDHCRSNLSPAAYLVDLLDYLDRDHDVWSTYLTHWHAGHGGAPYPFADAAAWTDYAADWTAHHPAEPVPNTEITPFQVLVERRPDLQHLPLACENTNTPVLYIDVVNETLEYFVVNGLSLAGYEGHDTDGSVPGEEVLASPQFVNDVAYDTLRMALFPPPLPFHFPLETLRRYFDHFDVPLAQAMEALRTGDAVERADPASYGWRDILMERLGLSREEYRLLTDRTVTLAGLYGYPPGTNDADVLAALTNMKAFTRRAGITYDELVELLGARFINPSADLIPRLERLGVDFATLKALKDGTIPNAAFDALLPAAIDAGQYDGDIKAWIRNDANYARIMGLITITNPSANDKLCAADALELRYAEPDNTKNTLHAIDGVRLLRFIRLWRKLGWTVKQLDAAISALYPPEQRPTGADPADDLARLDAGFLSLLPRLGVAHEVLGELGAKADELPTLLASWSPIDARGPDSLFRRMFGTAVTKQDPAFADDGYGNVLTDASQKLTDHAEALRAAFGLTGEELTAILGELHYDATTPLSLDTISAVFRRGWLARKLRVSVRELLLLTRVAALDPFSAPDPPLPAVVLLARLVHTIRSAGLKPTQALYLMWNQDISGKSVPKETDVRDLARALRTGFAAIESEFAVVDDPNGDVARARMALVYGAEATDFFFGLLDQTLLVDVPYAHPQPTLEQTILAAAPGRIGYDDFRKHLTYSGLMDTAARDALKTAADATPAFQAAVDALYTESQTRVAPFFTRYPELLPLCTAYAGSSDPPPTKRTALLAAFLPELKRRRKRQQALALVSSAAHTDGAFAFALLDDASVLHAAADAANPALADLTGVENGGLSASFFWGDTATAMPNAVAEAVLGIDYGASAQARLPANPAPGAAISAVWSGCVEPAESTLYNVRVQADAGATVTLTLDGSPVALTPTGTTWSNTNPIWLSAGTLVPLTLTVEKVKDVVTLSWETAGQGWSIVPSGRLYPAVALERMRATYIRFLKLVSLAIGLRLTADEIAYLAAGADYAIAGHGWANALTVSGEPDAPASSALRGALWALLDFARIKAALAPDDDRFLAALRDPATTQPNGHSPLLTLTGWDGASLDALLTRFGHTRPDLAHLAVFGQVYDAYAKLDTFGIGASALIAATTNAPHAETARAFQAALRARYDETDLLTVLRPINDGLRTRQRDALVAYVLTKLGDNPATQHINTPDKLFEFFLMDVEMDSCMETSRIRHALSSVQLFIDRCLMNLEPRVSPAALDAEQWKWMRRYRVWEANRKVFHWPENWLEPELRDDQSPFFKEAMSELLQSDITEDTAAVALLNYLSKLEEVAKLEPCGIHVAENAPGTKDDIVHVVARTTGAHRKYFYRRREYGYWTPWEQIRLDIEDNPIIPVVWKNRLFLFWLRILTQAPVDPNDPNVQPSSSGSHEELAKVHLSTVKTEAASEAKQKTKVTMQAVLCWSEYYNGKWQLAKTSDTNRPTSLGRFDPAGPHAFDRSALRLSTSERDGLLQVAIENQGWSSFVLYNTHSAPVRQEDIPPGPFLSHPWWQRGRSRFLDTSSETFTIDYGEPPGIDILGGPEVKPRPVLKNLLASSAVDPTHPLDNVWDAPFLYGDSRNLFYVTTAERLVTVIDSDGYGPMADPIRWITNIPPLVLKQPPRADGIPDPLGPMTKPGVGVVDPAPFKMLVSEDAAIRAAIGSTAVVKFGGRQIGPLGAVGAGAVEG
jgi:peptidoglycan hydrolase-like protein with peptidoglycan-binding domain